MTFHNLKFRNVVLANIREVVCGRKTGWRSFREFHSAAVLGRSWQQSHVLSKCTALLSQCVSVLWTILRHINLKIYLCPFYLHAWIWIHYKFTFMCFSEQNKAGFCHFMLWSVDLSLANDLPLHIFSTVNQLAFSIRHTEWEANYGSRNEWIQLPHWKVWM